MINETTPASSLTDKEREAIAQMPYEMRLEISSFRPCRHLRPADSTLTSPCASGSLAKPFAKRAQSLLGEVRAKLDAAQAEQATAANTAGTQDNLA